MLIAQEEKLVQRESNDGILRETKAYVDKSPMRNTRRENFSYQLMATIAQVQHFSKSRLNHELWLNQTTSV